MRIYNTLSGKKEEFAPQGDEVRMYVCGITPYAPSHLGHAMSYIFFDVVRRYLESKGFKVRHVQNFTDIDDKIIARSQEVGLPARELAEGFISQYFAEMDALNIKRAHVYPRATEEIPKIIEMVSGLLEGEHAYQVGGDVYFRVRACPGYGKLSGRTLEGMLAGARIEVDELKEHPLDFALWKGTKPGEPAWDSPWGPGRPGWHIECSAMSLKYLGETLDIHGGGSDLIFPHHENEIAQSECFTGVRPFARFWMHNGLMQLGQDKMSKSRGNLITVREALDKHSPDALRLLVLSSHYRSPLTYSEESLQAMERAAERLRRAARVGGEEAAAPAVDAEPYRERFIQALEDDLNAAQALGSLFELAREINRGQEEGLRIAEAQGQLREMSGVLGLTLEERAPVALAAEPFIELLVGTRAELRAAQQYRLADRIRGRLKELGIALEDTAEGTVWRHGPPTS